MSQTHAPGILWRAAAGILSLGTALNGFAMLFAPAAWYAAMPGVSATGPQNAHFIGDIGFAFLAAALALGLAARDPARDRRLVLPAAVFLIGHALLHVAELFGHGAPAGTALIVELLGVHLPAVVAALLAWPPKVDPVALAPASLIEQGIRQAERRLGVPLDYMRHIGRVAPSALGRLGAISGLMRHGPASPEAAAAQQMVALGVVMADDCGECVQIHVNLAKQAGMAAADLRAALEGRLDALPPDLALAFRFGRAVAENDPAMEAMQARLEQRFGAAAIVDFAASAGLSRFYPALKRALGFAKSCSLVKVAA